MRLPFTTEAFLNVFERYNTGVWPTQIFLYLLALVALFFAVKKRKWSAQIILIILGFFWLWMGIVYHIIFFAGINKAAYLFGLLFIIEGLMFFYYGVYRNDFSLAFERNIYGITGLVLIVFSLLVYPAIGYLVGHIYPKTPTFGLPCPTAIFTLGLLVWNANKWRFAIFIIPVLWSFVGFSAALSLGIFEDTGLLASGLATLVLFWVRRKKHVVKSGASDKIYAGS